MDSSEPGFAVHFLNYTNPAAHKGWIREFQPIGPQQVRMHLPQEMKVVRAELLRAESELPLEVSGNTVWFTIPRVIDYEIAALYAS